MGFSAPCRAASPTDENLVSQGNGLYRQNDFAGAKAKYAEAVSNDNTYADAYTDLSLACARLGEFEDAVTNVQQAIALEADNQQHRLNLGKIYAMQGLYSEAVAAFTEAINLDTDSDYKEAYYNRAWCYDEQANYEDAATDYGEAVDIDPQYAEAMVGMAITSAKQGSTNEAIWWCKRAIAASADDQSRSWINTLARQNLRTLRGEDYEFEDGASIPKFEQGLSKLVRHRTTEAISHFALLVDVETNSPLAHYIYARALTEADADDTNAPIHYTRALDLLPDASFESSPTDKPLFLDFYAAGSTSVSNALFPALYDLTLISLPCCHSDTPTIASPGPNAFSYTIEASNSLDVSALLVGDASSNALVKGETVRIELPALMDALRLEEFSILSADDLRTYGVDILEPRGFYGGEGTNLSATLSNASGNISVTKATASLTPGDDYFEFDILPSLPDNPLRIDVDFTVAWTSPFDSGGFVLRVFPDLPTPPVTEGFEGGSLANLAAYWSIESTSGSIGVSPTHPHSGTYALDMYDAVSHSSESYYQDAILHVDLSGSTNVTLDFWAKEYSGSSSSAKIEVSTEGTNWTGFGLINGNSDYQHYSLDLDSLGLTYSDDVRVKFHHSSYYSGGFAWDDIRVSTNLDIFGPIVTNHSPNGQVAGSITSFTVAFDEEVDGSSFNASDISVKDPVGRIVTLSGDPVDSGDQQTFTVNLSAGQTLPGVYRFTIVPNLTDTAGNPMNQDGDPINGEMDGQDNYSGTFEIGPIVAQSFPYTEDFEAGDIDALTEWGFAVTGSGTWDVRPSGNPERGAYHLKADQTDSTESSQSAILKMDLSEQSGATDLALDFWLQRLGTTDSYNYLRVSLSGNSTNWSTLPGADYLRPPTLGEYTHYFFDLDAALSNASIVVDSGVYVKFYHYGRSTSHEMTIDDIRVSDVDVFGPRVTGHALSSLTATDGPLTNIVVTFNEAIETASFTDAVRPGPRSQSACRR
jgi:tetratricopeptide (TPR) repeat protein